MSNLPASTATCGYRPKVGIFKDQPCLRDANHKGGHAFTAAQVAATVAQEAKHRPITDDEVMAAFTADEIRERAQMVDEVQDLWEQAKIKATPMLPCPNCTGRGTVVGGSLGDACDVCFGRRVVPDEGNPVVFDMPDFGVLRGPLVTYGNALAYRAHGVPVALPPASTVPAKETIEELRTRAMGVHRALAAGGAPARPALPPANEQPPRSGFEREGGIDTAASDAEIEAIEAEFQDHPGGGR